MKWLSMLGSSVYGHIILAFSILLAIVGYQKKELKEAKKEIENSNHNNNILNKKEEIRKNQKIENDKIIERSDKLMEAKIDELKKTDRKNRSSLNDI